MSRELTVSPFGSLMWPTLFKTKTVNKGEPDEKEVWQVDLLLEMQDAGAQAFVNHVRSLFVNAHGADARPGPNGLPYKRFKNEKGEETDLWVIKFARNSVTQRGTPLQPPVVTDSQNNAWPENMLIGNGSGGKVAFSSYKWESPKGGKGVSLQLEAVRIIQFIPYTPVSAVGAFGDPEPGFVLEQAAADPFAVGTGSWGANGGGPSEEEVPW